MAERPGDATPDARQPVGAGEDEGKADGDDDTTRASIASAAEQLQLTFAEAEYSAEACQRAVECTRDHGRAGGIGIDLDAAAEWLSREGHTFTLVSMLRGMGDMFAGFPDGLLRHAIERHASTREDLAIVTLRDGLLVRAQEWLWEEGALLLSSEDGLHFYAPQSAWEPSA